jgi:pilus assembly protein CpaE
MASESMKIAISTTDLATVEAVKRALPNSSDLAYVCRHVSELISRLKHAPVAVALVDIDANPERILRELASVAERYPHLRLAVVSGIRDDGLLVSAMQAGARHVFLKQTIAVELPAVLPRLLQAGGDAATEGLIVTVLSASGGCGATTVAVNLANELSLMSAGQALIVDMDASYGSVATYLGVEGSYSVADVLARGAGEVDAELIRTSAIVHSDKLHALISPASVDFSNPKPLNNENLPDLLDACQRAYEHTVIDAPRVTMETAATLARASRMTLIVFQLMIKDIRTVLSMVAALKDRGVSLASVSPIANRYRKRTPTISVQDGQKALGELSLKCTSNDFGATIKSLNFGQPLAKIAPRSVFRKELADLASSLVRRTSKGAEGGKA